MKSHFGTLFFGLFVVFIAWVTLGSTPQDRMSRACEPVLWGGKFTTSITDLFIPQYSGNVNSSFQSGFYNCQYVLWRQFYEADYLAAVERARKKSEAAVK